CQAPFDIRIKQSKIRTDWATAIMPIDCRSMPAQHVRRIRVQAQEEVIFNGKSTARRSCLNCPVQISARVFRQRDPIIEFGYTAAEIGIADQGTPCCKAFQMQPVLVLPVDQPDVDLRVEPPCVAAIGEQLRQAAFSGAVPIFEATAKLHAIVRYVPDMNPDRVSFVVEETVGTKLRTNVPGHVPALRAPTIPQLEMEQPWPRQRYLEPAFDPAAVGVPPVVSVDIYTTIPNIPQIHVRGFDLGRSYSTTGVQPGLRLRTY